MTNMQERLDRLSEQWRAERSQTQMTIGKAIEALEGFAPDKPLETPLGKPDSYRGYYSDLAFPAGQEITTVGELGLALLAAKGGTYIGYKGGEFVMSDDTPLWFAPYGACGPKIMDLVIHGPVVRMLLEDEGDL